MCVMLLSLLRKGTLLLLKTQLRIATTYPFKVRKQEYIERLATHPLSLPTELPLPDVSIIINSTAGLGSEECLGLELGTASDSVVCEARVVPNLVNLPNISLWRDEAHLQSNLTLKLKYAPIEQLVGEFHCRVCINVIQSNIEDYCSNSTVTTSGNSEGNV